MSRWSPATASAATLAAVEEYSRIAQENNITPSQLAIAFCRSKRFISDNGSIIVGATTLEQLKENLSIFENDEPLSEEILEAINEVHMKCRDPSCSL